MNDYEEGSLYVDVRKRWWQFWLPKQVFAGRYVSIGNQTQLFAFNNVWLAVRPVGAEEMTTLDEVLDAIRKQTKDRKKLMDTLPKREWVGLTEEEVYEAWRVQGTSSADINPVKIFDVAERIEAKLKEKNT